MIYTGLFIGGPIDGERLVVNPNAQIWQVPIMLESLDGPAKYEVKTYTRHRIEGHTNTYYVWCFESMTVDEMMHRLISGYTSAKIHKLTP